jgi:hypothetical protein
LGGEDDFACSVGFPAFGFDNGCCFGLGFLSGNLLRGDGSVGAIAGNPIGKGGFVR